MLALVLDLQGLTGLLTALTALAATPAVAKLISLLTRREVAKAVGTTGDDDRTVLDAIDGLRAETVGRFDSLESRVTNLEQRGSPPAGELS